MNLKNKKNNIFMLIFSIQILIVLIIYTLFINKNMFFTNNPHIFFLLSVSFFVFFNFIISFSFLLFVSKKEKETIIRDIISQNQSKIGELSKTGIMILNKNKKIIWLNKYLSIIKPELLDQNAEKLDVFLLDKEKEYIEIKDRYFKKELILDGKIIVLRDLSEYNYLKQEKNQKAPVFANIIIDNYNDIYSILEEAEMIELETKVRTLINEWAYENNIVLKRTRNDSYIALFDEEKYKEIKDQEFEILNKIRKIKKEDNNLTISIGIGRKSDSFFELSKLSTNALDVALSRGGDQIVVNTNKKNMEFYGLSSETKSKRHKVKVRVVSKSLAALVESSKNIYIMGHKKADFDSMGAALGIYLFCKHYGKEAKIIFDEKEIETNARVTFKNVFEKKEMDEKIITSKKAIDKIKEEDLLVLVDFSNKELAMSEQLLEKSKSVAIIDHHRPIEKLVNQEFSYQESAASSTCEMISEIIRYNEQNIRITPNVATFMLAGILMDTNFYKNKTGARTYGASMILKEFGASNDNATEFLKEEYEEKKLRTKIMANAITPYYGVVVATAPDKEIIETESLAKTAGEIIDLKEIKASFVLGLVEKEKVGISARSNGKINVQKIMEKMNGGGHYGSAATKIDSNDIEAIKEELLSILEDLKEEIN